VRETWPHIVDSLLAEDDEAPADRRSDATADSEAAQAAEDQVSIITAEQADEITESLARLMILPIPEKLRDRIRDALDEMASGPIIADTSQNPDMLRIWLPTVLRGQAQEGGQG
jgi:hypothetical protein